MPFNLALFKPCIFSHHLFVNWPHKYSYRNWFKLRVILKIFPKPFGFASSNYLNMISGQLYYCKTSEQSDFGVIFKSFIRILEIIGYARKKQTSLINLQSQIPPCLGGLKLQASLLILSPPAAGKDERQGWVESADSSLQPRRGLSRNMNSRQASGQAETGVPPLNSENRFESPAVCGRRLHRTLWPKRQWPGKQWQVKSTEGCVPNFSLLFPVDSIEHACFSLPERWTIIVWFDTLQLEWELLRAEPWCSISLVYFLGKSECSIRATNMTCVA